MKRFLKVWGEEKWKSFDFLRGNLYQHIKHIKSRTYSA